jgi:uncharacterized cupin superfamily protein
MTWSLGDRAVVQGTHPWRGRRVEVTRIVSGLVVRVSDAKGNNTIIRTGDLKKQ